MATPKRSRSRSPQKKEDAKHPRARSRSADKNPYHALTHIKLAEKELDDLKEADRNALYAKCLQDLFVFSMDEEDIYSKAQHFAHDLKVIGHTGELHCMFANCKDTDSLEKLVAATETIYDSAKEAVIIGRFFNRYFLTSPDPKWDRELRLFVKSLKNAKLFAHIADMYTNRLFRHTCQLDVDWDSFTDDK